jgi:hypothetical protein
MPIVERLEDFVCLLIKNSKVEFSILEAHLQPVMRADLGPSKFDA